MTDSGVMATAKEEDTRTGYSRDGGFRKMRGNRWSDAEWAWLLEQAEEKGITRSALIRSKALRGMPTENPDARP